MRLACGLLSLVFAGTVTCIAQDPTPPRSTWNDDMRIGVLGDYFEGLFQTQFNVCINGQPTKQKLTMVNNSNNRRQKDVTAVPAALMAGNMRSAQNAVKANSSIGRAFAYIYSAPTMDVPTPNGNLYLVTDYLETPTVLLGEGLPNLAYDFSCSANLAATLSANTNWSFPVAQVKAALNGDFNSDKSYHLAVVSGTFRSPLWKHLGAADTSDWSNYARLLIWDWYATHPDQTLITTDRFLLDQFNGVAVYQLFKSSQNLDGSGQLDLSAGVSQANIKTALQASYGTKTNLRAEDFAVLVREKLTHDGEDDVFVPFPKATSLAANLNVSTRVHLEDNSSVKPFHAMTTHTQIVRGMPVSLCTRDWTAEATPSVTGSLAVTSAPIDGASIPSCRFQITYQFDAGNQATEPPSGARATLDFALVNRIFSGSTETAKISLKADKVSFSVSGRPYLVDITPVTPTASSTPIGTLMAYSFDWKLDYPVVEDVQPGEKVMSVGSNPTAVKLSCGTGRDIPLQSVSATYSSGVLHLSAHAASDSRNGQLDLNPQNVVACTLTGGVTFSLASNFSVATALPKTTVFYAPVVAPAAVVAPSPVVAPAPVVTPAPVIAPTPVPR